MLLLLAALAGLHLGAPPSDEVQHALARAYAEESIQREWPTKRAAPPPPAARGSLPSSLVWVLGAVALALVALLIARGALARAPKEVEPPRVDAAGPGPRGRAPPAVASEALAAEGRWAEAVHALWLEALSEAGGPGIEPALTSREALRHVAVPEATRQALGRLVAAVELSLFGGRPTAEAQWRECLAHRAAARGRAATERA